MRVRFWVDPICPWCWVTARWVMDIAPERDLEVVWEPISLLQKNDVQPDAKYYEYNAWTRDLLRVMEAVRAAGFEHRLGDLYREYGARIHHDRERMWDPAVALAAVGLDPALATAAADDTWDAELRRRMDEGLALVGNDVGTPIIAFDTDDGRTVGIFGPVVTRVPPLKDALALWDSVTTLAAMPGFWELKRTRTESPEFGDRP